MALEHVKETAAQAYSALNLLSDEDLMLQLQQGDGDALAVLFDRYNRLIISIAWRILRDAGESEDLMQSVFLEIFRSAAQFDPNKGTAKVWILQYAYHRSFNRRQYLNRRGNYDDPQEIDTLAVMASKPYSRMLDSMELKHMLEEAMGRLSPVQRIIFELVFHDGLTMKEIAEKTGKSFDSVRHQYYRGMETLRSIWCEQTVSPVIAVLGRERFVGS
jgi:RNA polymerase sigma-70 factor (ECF subfamily)